MHDNVLEGLTALSEVYNRKYRDNWTWTYVISGQIASEMYLSLQPRGNATDCDVLVCMYIWSVIVGVPWPNTRALRNQTRRFSELM